jgi:CRISPR-associated protein Cas4
MEPLAVGIGMAVLLAVLLLLAAQWLRWRSGLPSGEIIYDDTSGQVGAVLTSRRYGLRGKPDYLLEGEADNLIPVEVKSGAAPRTGSPYASHLMQLAVYFVLVEDVLQRPAPYGLIRYRDRTIRVANTEKLRAELLAILAQMRAASRTGEARRSHYQAPRCRSCSVAYACDERLA